MTIHKQDTTDILDQSIEVTLTVKELLSLFSSSLASNEIERKSSLHLVLKDQFIPEVITDVVAAPLAMSIHNQMQEDCRIAPLLCPPLG